MYDAMIRKDEAALAKVLDDSFVLIHMTGMRQPKTAFLRAVMDGTLNYFSARHENMPVSVSGDTATITGQSYVAAVVSARRAGTTSALDQMNKYFLHGQMPEDLKALVVEIGFLPFFSSDVPGFFVDDLTPIEVWDEYLGLGPWLWRDEIARDKTGIYGWFFRKKTGYVSIEWFPYLANYRRDGYDFDARCDEGLARNDDARIYEIIERHGPITAPELRRRAMTDPKRASAFEAALTRLQMMTYVVPVDFIFPGIRSARKGMVAAQRFAICRNAGLVRMPVSRNIKRNRRIP